LRKTRAIIIYLTCLLVFAVGGCATLKPPPPQPEVLSLTPAKAGVLAEVSTKISTIHGPGQSAFMLLIRNDDAMNWRLALIDHATVSIDAQYFIWQSDEAGILLFDRLLQAADRGIRIRLLVDDLVFAAKDSDIAAISSHPNFEIKIFNPGFVRDSTLGGLGEFLLYFRELNRRMHNKLLVVDGCMAVVGGRNIGNEYFGLSKKYNFRDLDLLVSGDVLVELSEAFDVYWNAEAAYPGAAMAEINGPDEMRSLRDWVSEYLTDRGELLSSYPQTRRSWVAELQQLPSRMKTGEAHFMQDEPVQIGEDQYRLLDMLDYLAEPSHKELMMVSPYLIPVGGFLEHLAKLATEGVTVKILTGSMGANNHTVAHSHYKKYRRRILQTRAELYEFRHDATPEIRDLSDVPPARAKFISLHVKALVGDRKRCFIGSLNLDPRAIEINTENGLYIESSELANELAEQFDMMMAQDNAWQVYLTPEGHIRWKSSSGMVALQPARSFGQRVADFFFRLLPVESQL
jgi:putative cardiolipin synthase